MKFLTNILGGICILLAGCASGVETRVASNTGAGEACRDSNEAEIAALFENWNRALQTRDPQAVVALYDLDSILLPTLSNKPRFSPEEKADYFVEFMKNGPVGGIDLRKIRIGCNSAVDAGLYSFTFAATGVTVNARYSFTYQWDGKRWGITSHHSSLMPEGKL